MILNKKKSPSNRSRHNDSHYENIFERNVNFRERIIYINSDIEDWSLELFQKAFDELERGEGASKPIRIEISSYGGSIYDMLGMLDRIQASPCHIITRGFGKIMSAATFLLASGDERYMGKNSWFMMHEGYDSFEGKFSDLKVELKHFEDIEKQLYKLYEKYSNGKTKARTFERLCEKNCYISSDKVLKLGLIDFILEG